MATAKGLVLAAILAASSPALAREPVLSDDQVRSRVVEESVASYLAGGRPCACPYSTARNGSSCGGRSAYSRPGGAAPMCYPRDVSDAAIRDWRARHPASRP